jgi:3-hydroxyisobutyrate dehydrogenase-like beta-hydroxyacid dehydrogenase
VFATFSKQVVHRGQIGAGQYGKLFNNTLMAFGPAITLDTPSTSARWS